MKKLLKTSFLCPKHWTPICMAFRLIKQDTMTLVSNHFWKSPLLFLKKKNELKFTINKINKIIFFKNGITIHFFVVLTFVFVILAIIY